MFNLRVFSTSIVAVVKAHVKSAVYFRSKFIVDTFITIFRVGLLLLVYMNIYKVAPQAGAILPYNSALWSIGAYFIALALMARRMYSRVSSLIYTGNIETYLVRPMHILVFAGAQLLGESLLQALVTTIAVVALLLVSVGLPTGGITFTLVFGGGFLLITGIIVEMLLASLVGLFAIWLERAEPIWWICDKFILILGGSYVPVAFFPEALKVISRLSPFGATRFASYAFYPNFGMNFWQYAAVQLFWIVVLLFAITYVFKKGQRHLFVNGS
jgi:ABC-2 type transport system permease protein